MSQTTRLRIEHLPAESLKPWPGNPRVMPQREAV